MRVHFKSGYTPLVVSLLQYIHVLIHLRMRVLFILSIKIRYDISYNTAILDLTITPTFLFTIIYAHELGILVAIWNNF